MYIYSASRGNSPKWVSVYICAASSLQFHIPLRKTTIYTTIYMWACGAFLLQSLVCVKGMAHATLGLSGLVGYCMAGFLTLANLAAEIFSIGCLGIFPRPAAEIFSIGYLGIFPRPDLGPLPVRVCHHLAAQIYTPIKFS